jgi:hypothetical protein
MVNNRPLESLKFLLYTPSDLTASLSFKLAITPPSSSVKKGRKVEPYNCDMNGTNAATVCRVFNIDLKSFSHVSISIAFGKFGRLILSAWKRVVSAPFTNCFSFTFVFLFLQECFVFGERCCVYLFVFLVQWPFA